MPGVADSGLQEPDHELAVVQQVHKGSITNARTKAQLTVKLPGKLVSLYTQDVCSSWQSSIT
jgi:hypothetical protein